MPTRIILVRHGETEWNKEERIQGHRDIPLTDVGREQAKRLGYRLRDINLRTAYTSDLARARETAEIALRNLNVVFHPSPAFRERSFGVWEGKLWKEIINEFPEEARQFKNDPLNFAPPGGETWLTMQKRVFNEMKAVAARHIGENVAIFTHGGPAKAAVLEALDLPSTKWRGLSADNASLNVLEWYETLSIWRLLSFNDVCHLNGLAAPVGTAPNASPKENFDLWLLEK